jgi:uroporphyrinogen decarboxylase
MERLARSLIRYIRAQVDAGCQAVQLFDSWAGCLSPADYARYVLPYTKTVIDGIPAGVPVINFLTGNPALLPLIKQAGGSVIGLDWRVDLMTAWNDLGDSYAVQGNLDPLVLQDWSTAKRQAEDLLTAVGSRPGHIFNLGHGVLPETPPDNVKALVELVHERSAALRRNAS